MSWLRRIFSRTAKAQSPAPEVKAAAVYTRSEPAWAFSYSSSARPDDLQKASAWVFACADKIATALAACPVVIYRGGEVVPWLSDDPLAALLREPTPDMTWSAWLEEVGLYAILTGCCYLEKVRVRAYGMSVRYPTLGLPVQLWASGANAWKAKVDSDSRRQQITSYEPKTGSDRTPVQPSEIVRIAYARLGKRADAMSKIEPVEREIGADRGASEWQLSALKNRGVPDGIIKVAHAYNELQEQEIVNQIDSEWAGARNAHRPLILGQGADWIDLAKTAVEMEMIEGRRFTRSAICAVMGVPEVIFEASAATYANLEASLLILISQTVLPLAGRIIDALNLGICREYGPDAYLEVDMGAVDALLPILRARWEIAEKALNRGVPMSQVSDTLRLGVEAYPGWDVGLVPSSNVPVSDLTMGISNADLGLGGQP